MPPALTKAGDGPRGSEPRESAGMVATAPEEAANTAEPVAGRILVVAGGAGGRADLAGPLAQAGYSVCATADAESACAALGAHYFDLVLVESVLPTADGFEICRRIRQTPAGEEVPVVLVEGSTPVAAAQARAVECGADGCIRRPLASQELLAWVRAFTRIAKLNRAMRRQAEVLQENVASTAKVQANLLLNTSALSAAANGIVITTCEGRIQWINPAFARLSGYSAAESIGRNPRDLLRSGQQSAEFYRDLWRTILAGDVWRGEIVNRRKDGSTYTEEMTITPFCETGQSITHFIAIKQDITARKHAEAELRSSQSLLRALTNRLQTVREEEATRIAREIHDELGQQLTGLKMDLRWLEHGLEEIREPRISALLEKAVSATELADATLRSVQRIAAELRPAILDKLGLTAALQREANVLQRSTGIGCTFTLPEGELRLPGAVGIACFRIFQEAMTNATRHSGATALEVELRVPPEGLWLEVRDNGCGIAPGALVAESSLGLLGMRERAHALGGQLFVLNRQPRGTIIRLVLPKERLS